MILILKKAMHEPCGYSLDFVSSFDSIKTKQTVFIDVKTVLKIFVKI